MSLQSGVIIALVSLCSVPCKCNTLEFNSVPTTVKTHENSTVLLPCYLDTKHDNVDSVRIKWYKNTELWADNGPPGFLPPERFTLWGNGSLEVVDIRPEDTGEYVCEVVRGEPWSPIRQVHAIEVLHPPSITTHPRTGFLQVKLDEEVRMECIADGVPKPIITWKHNGEHLQLINNRNVLHFNASSRHLAGTYECIATNGVGDPGRKQIQLRILYPPEITITKSWFHTAPGLRIQLECKVSADPPAYITWHKGEKAIKTDGRVLSLHDADKHLLVIKKVYRADFGLYICKATNDVGISTVEFQISGAPNPGVFKITDDKNDAGDDSYTFIWEVDSYSPVIEYNLQFRPYKSTNTINKPEWTTLTIPSDRSNSGPVYSKKYTIRGLKERTAYEVQMKSRNLYGWSRPSPILRFATPGGELTEEIITPAITEPDNSISPGTSMEIIASAGSYALRPLSITIGVIFTLYYLAIS